MPLSPTVSEQHVRKIQPLHALVRQLRAPRVILRRMEHLGFVCDAGDEGSTNGGCEVGRVLHGRTRSKEEGTGEGTLSNRPNSRIARAVGELAG